MRAGMDASPLRQDCNQRDDKTGEDCGCEITADLKAAVGYGFVKQIAERRSERPRENESGPEQRHTRSLCGGIKRENADERAGEQDCAASIAEIVGVGDPIAERGAERLGKQDRTQ